MPKKHIRKPKPPPPDTERFCLGCQKMTIWRYNKMYGHSRCTECGGAFSTQEKIPNNIISGVAKRLMPWLKVGE